MSEFKKRLPGLSAESAVRLQLTVEIILSLSHVISDVVSAEANGKLSIN